MKEFGKEMKKFGKFMEEAKDEMIKDGLINSEDDIEISLFREQNGCER